jgi:clan AA aspartic protease
VDGFLDELHQAFVTLQIGRVPLDFLVDTGFAGTLVIGHELFDPTQAQWVGESEADLAAGQTHLFDLYEVEFVWLGQPTRTTIFVGPGKECLLGTALLSPHQLEINYRQRTVRLIVDSEW